MRFFLLFITSLLFGGVDRNLPYPTKIDANEIAKQVYFVNHQFYLDNQLLKFKRRYSVLIVRRAKGKKPRVLRAERYLNNDYNDGITRSKDLVIFRSGNLKGTGVLAREFVDENKSLEILMWIPALRKVRRMAEPARNVGYSEADVAFMEETKLRRLSEDVYKLMGTHTKHFVWERMSFKPSELNRFTKQLPQGKKVFDKRVYILKATPKEDAWYDYRIDYVDTKHFTVYRTNFYVDDKIVKIIYREWEKVKGIDDVRAYMWTYWYSINPQTKFETVNYIPKQIIDNNDKKIKASFWSAKTLRLKCVK